MKVKLVNYFNKAIMLGVAGVLAIGLLAGLAGRVYSAAERGGGEQGVVSLANQVQREMSKGAEKPSIRFTKVPAFGSYGNLQGVVRGVDPALYQVAVYIKVRKGWWTKPYWSRPATQIFPDGTWICDVTTGGIDQYASQFAAFLIPKTVSPPLRRGEGSLPGGVQKKAVAKAIVHRTGSK